MKTDGAPLNGSYFDLLEAKHPDLQPAAAGVRRPSRPRPVRRRRGVGSLLAVAIGALAGVVWLAVALRPVSQVPAPQAGQGHTAQQAGQGHTAQQAVRPAVERAAALPAGQREAVPAMTEANQPPVAAGRDLAASRRQVAAAAPVPSAPVPAASPAVEETPRRPTEPPASRAPARRPSSEAAAPARSPAARPKAEGSRPLPVAAAPTAALLPVRAISSPPPEYPHAARLAGEEGTVVVEAAIDAAGAVKGTTVVRGRSPALDVAAATALGRWRFEPATRGGVAVESTHRVRFKFTLEPAEPGPEPAAESPAPLRVDAAVQPPRRLTAPLPAYPDAAWASGISGNVLVRAMIDENGEVTVVEVLKGLPYGITEAAVQAIRRWKFAPATRDGQPVTVYRDISIRFES